MTQIIQNCPTCLYFIFIKKKYIQIDCRNAKRAHLLFHTSIKVYLILLSFETIGNIILI